MRNDPWTVLADPAAEKVVLQPKITAFTASRYNVGNGGPVTLEWAEPIEPAANFELRATVRGAVTTLVAGKQRNSVVGQPTLRVTNTRILFSKPGRDRNPLVPMPI